MRVQKPTSQRLDQPILDTDLLYHNHTTVVPAVHLAYRLGATAIGVIGCDIIDHHLADRIYEIDWAFNALRFELALRGIRLVTLAVVSRLVSMEKVHLQEWLDAVAA